jgi:glycosyltransferase involved in cell wall biosynthesis
LKILIIHNAYGKYSGEEAVIDANINILEKVGHKVIKFSRSSEEITSSHLGKYKAFFTSFYNPCSIKTLRILLNKEKPDIIHIHNLYPLISPSILPFIRKYGIPVIMTVHNYRLVCPNGLFYNGEKICEACSNGKEWNCIINNCEKSILKSLSYALRNASSRIFKYYKNNIDAFLCLTEFQRQKLIQNGFPENRCHTLPNFLGDIKNKIIYDTSIKENILFLGRINKQKGFDILINAAKRCKNIKFKVAGKPDKKFINIDNLPENVQWLGIIDGQKKEEALNTALALVFTSRSYEGFPMVFLEAMQHGIPVIAPRLGGYPEIIREGKNGWLYEPENEFDLIRILNKVNQDRISYIEYQNNIKEIMREEYSPKIWLDRYIDIIKNIIHTNNK